MNTVQTQRARVTVVGAGGNIGSHLVTHLARMPAVSVVTLIDRDRYEPKNLASQDITIRDVGRPKARVQAERLMRIRPDLRVRAICDTVERVPIGLLRADVVLACLDSLVARQWVNQAAWRLGCCWIDAGEWEQLALGRQVMLDAAHRRHYVTRFRRNPRCLFDHKIWAVRKLDARPSELSVGQALKLGDGGGGPTALHIDWHRIVRRLACTSCGQGRQGPAP